MWSDNVLTMFFLIIVASVLAYRVSLLKNNKIGYFSLLQILYLVIVPGILLILGFDYIQSVVSRPANPQAFFSDDFLISMFLLSSLFAYGGVAIHSVTKMMSDTALRHDDSEVAVMNRYYHTTFSHNLIYSGGILFLVSLTLLEIHHVPDTVMISWWSGAMRGIVLGLVLMAALFFYTRSRDTYAGRWWDLKTFFLIVWLSLIVLAYAVAVLDPRFRQYQLLFPVLFSFALLAFLNIVLVFRRLKRGGVRVRFDWRRLMGNSKD